MRLVGVHIENYGPLHDFSLTEEELSPGPCLIYGLNEAGKSTLLSFIRAVLFGYKSEGVHGEPVGDRPNSGWLLLEEGGEIYRVKRSGRGNGRVVVELPDGSRAGEELLKTGILRGVSPALFKNIFAFGMDELRKLEDLARDEVSAHIYGAGTGTGPQRLAGAAAWLDKTAGTLFKPRGRAPVLNKLLGELDALDRQIKELEQQPEQYNTLQQQLKELEGQKDRLRAERDEGQRRLRRLDNLLKARAPWNELQQCLVAKGRVAAGFTPATQFPDDGMERLSSLEARRDEKQAEIRAWDKKVQAIAARLADIKVDEKILACAAEIEELTGERSLYLEKKQMLAELKARVTEGERAVQEKLSSLGPGWNENKLMQLDTSLAVRRQVDDFSRRFMSLEQKTADCSARLSGVRRELTGLKATKEAFASQLAALPAPLDDNGITAEQRLEMLDQAAVELEQQQRHRFMVDIQQNKLAEINERRQRLETSLGQAAGAKKPLWPVLAPVLLGCLGAGVALHHTALGLLIMGGGIGLAVLLYGILAGQARERHSRAEELRGEIAALEKARAAAEQELARLNNEITAGVDRLRRLALALNGRETLAREDIPGLRQRLLGELETRRVRRELLARLEQAAGALSRATGEMLQVEKEQADLQKAREKLEDEWRQWLSHGGLPLLDTGAAADFLTLVERIADGLRGLQAERKTLEQAAVMVREYEDRVIALAEKLGQTRPSRNHVAGYITHVANLLNEQLEGKARCMRYEEELQEAREGQKLALDNLAAIEQDIQELLDLVDAGDTEDFRRRMAFYRELRQLEHRIETLGGQLLNIAGSAGDLQELHEELVNTTRGEHEAQLRALEEFLARAENELARLGDQSAAIKQQLQVLENGEELARARQQRAMLRERLAARARHWQVTVLCAALLEMAREKHERERQPAVLARASRLIGPMTRGRYTRVVAPVGETTGLVVEEPGGSRVPARFLSRGAAGQLYLAVRMALAEHFSSVVAPMPIILDDILVDFDAGRMRGAWQVIKKMAQKQQIIFFTCHDYIVAAAREQLTDFSLVRLENGVKVSQAGL
ncbi:AAA family ATPase [Desulfallas thermosapovorans]|uniref:Uncharacterized protein YhaN n=1 Tax=Desulfallas thermosapovorans DSM 6562 TaxID=1121431 RepID=A0A5S4ZPA7_9FIRM|nr:AAA family ATPase [Desulfallas thermosapovorans]TYO94468.1 uncharacterized protein YhaN [Desulfallas thermosapovorans DSM 6562]